MTAVVDIGDLFCGAGGSSTGLARACADLGLKLRLTAVNHWAVAIATHTKNHPGARHWCMDLDQARPFDLVPERKLDILWGSPSCTEHSYAKGGNDVDDQMRASAWAIPRMAEALRPKIIIVENVPPFRNWGPVETDKKTGKVRPIKSRKGETYRAWFSAVESLGYTGRDEIINSADFGEAQTRNRLFIVFTAPGINYSFPLPTHAKRGSAPSLLGKREEWRAARDIIDWSLKGGSIFERKTPLAPNTMRRIEAGIRRYCSGALAEAFLVVLRNHADASSLNDPTPTVTAGGTHIGLAEPTLTAFVGANRTNNVPRDVDEPMATITTAPANMFLAEPTAFVLGQNGGSIARDVADPLPTVAADGAISIVEPFVVDVRHGEKPRVASVDDPLHTLTAKNGAGVCEPFITSYYGAKGGEPRTRSIDEPIPTVPTENRFGVVEPFIVPQMGEGTRSIDVPAPTVTTTTRGMRLIEPTIDLVEPVIVPADASAPRGRVIEIDGKPYMLDVRFRMLQPHELARAQGFPDDYVFTGTKSDQTAQIGNAVPEKVAYALGRTALLSLGYGVAEDAA